MRWKASWSQYSGTVPSNIFSKPRNVPRNDFHWLEKSMSPFEKIVLHDLNSFRLIFIRRTFQLLRQICAQIALAYDTNSHTSTMYCTQSIQRTNNSSRCILVFHQVFHVLSWAESEVNIIYAMQKAFLYRTLFIAYFKNMYYIQCFDG